jgi:hypothetical protein
MNWNGDGRGYGLFEGIFLGGPGTITENVNQGIECPNQDVKQAPPKYKSDALPPE